MADVIKIKGIEFAVTSPYAEGHVLTEVEANVLNQTRHENMRNNFAPKVAKAIEEAEKAGTPVDAAALQAAFAAYQNEYEFGAKREGNKVVVDPVDREALRIAKNMVKEALKKKGANLKSVGIEKITELAEKLIEKNPKIREQAEAAVAAAKALSAAVDLGDGDDADTE